MQQYKLYETIVQEKELGSLELSHQVKHQQPQKYYGEAYSFTCLNVSR